MQNPLTGCHAFVHDEGMETTTSTTTKRFAIWEDGVGCGTWEAPDAVSALRTAIAGASWDEHHEGRTITITAQEETYEDVADAEAASAEVTIRDGRAVDVTIEAQ